MVKLVGLGDVKSYNSTNVFKEAINAVSAHNYEIGMRYV